MQGSNEDCLPMKGHTRGGDTPTVLAIEWTHRGGGRTFNVTQRTDTHIFTMGGTHPQCNPMNGHTQTETYVRTYVRTYERSEP